MRIRSTSALCLFLTVAVVLRAPVTGANDPNQNYYSTNDDYIIADAPMRRCRPARNIKQRSPGQTMA